MTKSTTPTNLPLADGVIDFGALNNVSRSERLDVADLLTPKLTEYIPHIPTPKQAAFLLLPHREAFYGGAAGGGKALALDTEVKTMFGLMPLADIHPGMWIWNEHNELTQVIAESEIMYDHKVYELVWWNDDNEFVEVVADAGHLWTLRNGTTCTTENLVNRLRSTKPSGYMGCANHSYSLVLPKAPPNRSPYRLVRATEVPSVPVKCIKVDNPTGLFQITGNGIVTHNSDALLMGALQYADIPGYAGIIFRKSFADLNKPGALIPRAKEWLMPFEDVKWQEKQNRFMFYERYGKKKAEKSVLQFGYLSSAKDLENYQGGEYQFIGFDELTHFKASYYTYMFSRLRRLMGMEIPLRVRSASNPPQDSGGIWVYDRFVNVKTRKKNAIFIPAGLDDNPFLDKEEYEQSLEELDPVTKARLRDGNWEVRYQGNMFKRAWCRPIDASELPTHRRMVRFWDLAATEPSEKNPDPDWSVGFLMSEANGSYFIEDIVRFRRNPGETEKAVGKTASVDAYGVRIRMEEEPGSSGKNNTSNFARKVLRGRDFMGVRSSGSKELRASPFSAACARGDVYVVRDCRNLTEFWDEAEGFPGPHDDMVDAGAGAFNQLSSMPPMTLPHSFGAGDQSYWEGDGSTSLGHTSGFWRGP